MKRIVKAKAIRSRESLENMSLTLEKKSDMKDLLERNFDVYRIRKMPNRGRKSVLNPN